MKHFSYNIAYILYNELLYKTIWHVEQCFHLGAIPLDQDQLLNIFIQCTIIELKSSILVNSKQYFIVTLKLHLGVLIYKVMDDAASYSGAHAMCDQDSALAAEHLGDTTVSGFFHLPWPRDDAQNEFYDGLTPDYQAIWLDISEQLPMTNPRQWVNSDGVYITWTKWHPREPNNYQGSGEHNVELYNGAWNDSPGRHAKTVVCTYALPGGAENLCPWLRDFEN